jgi:hypothetical protein
MKYEDLTIEQRIALKGHIWNDPELKQIKLVWLLWNFKKAVEYFLNEDLNALQ